MPAFRMFLVAAAGTLLALFAAPLASSPATAGASTITSPPTVAATNWTSSSAAAGSGSNQLNDVSCTTSTFCVAVGLENNGTGGGTLIEQWNGTSWTVVPSVNAPATTGDSLNSVSCVGTAFCLAVGGSITGPAVAETWNGTAWSFVTAAAPAGEHELAALVGLLRRHNDVRGPRHRHRGRHELDLREPVERHHPDGNDRRHPAGHVGHPSAQRNRHGLCQRQLVHRGRGHRHPVHGGVVLQRVVERHGVGAPDDAPADDERRQPAEFGVVRRGLLLPGGRPGQPDRPPLAEPDRELERHAVGDHGQRAGHLRHGEQHPGGRRLLQRHDVQRSRFGRRHLGSVAGQPGADVERHHVVDRAEHAEPGHRCRRRSRPSPA